MHVVHSLELSRQQGACWRNPVFGAGIVYRDIETAKPRNGLVDQDADVIVLTDVGVGGLRAMTAGHGFKVLATRKPRVSNRTLILRLARTAARISEVSLRQEPPRITNRRPALAYALLVNVQAGDVR